MQTNHYMRTTKEAIIIVTIESFFNSFFVFYLTTPKLLQNVFNETFVKNHSGKVEILTTKS